MPFTALEKEIIRTLTYFDVIDYPLTLLEIRKFLAVPATPSEILDALDSPALKSLTFQNRGLYGLSRNACLADLRLKRYRLAGDKMKRAMFWSRLICLLPYVKAVAVYSSLALKNSDTDSDIDLFIITACGRIWTARFFVNTFLKLLRQRPDGLNTSDKLCASYFVSEENLNLSAVNYPGFFLPYYEGTTFLFTAGDKIIAEQFFAANNWLKAKLPNWQAPAALIQTPNRLRFIKSAKQFLAGIIPEKYYKKWQWQILPQKYFTACDGRNVALTATLIKLHHQDKRCHNYRLFEERFNALINHV